MKCAKCGDAASAQYCSRCTTDHRFADAAAVLAERSPRGNLALTGFTKTDTAGKLYTKSWAKLTGLFARPKTYKWKDVCPLIKLGVFKDNSRANGSKLLRLDALQADVDKAGGLTVAEAAQRLRAAGVRAVIYTSANHLVRKEPFEKYDGGARFRVVCPLYQPITGETQLWYLMSVLNSALGGIVAGESWEWSRCYYMGKVEGVPYEFEAVDGECIDIVSMAPDFDPIEPPETPKAAREMDLTVVADERDDDVGRYMIDAKIVLGRARQGLHTPCPRAGEHGANDSISATTWLFATATEVAHIDCRHESHKTSPAGKITNAEFFNFIRYQEDLGFDAVTQSEAEAAEGAKAAIRNAKKAANKMPSLVLETDIERAQRAGRERSRTIGEGSAVLPVQGIMSGTEMLEDLVFLSEGSRVSRVSDPRFVLTFADFKATTEASATFVQSPSGRKLKKANAQLWLEHKDRKTVRTQTFAPGRPMLCTSPGNVPAQNLWAPRTATAPTNWRVLSAPFFDHVEYLVPVAAERERFLDWLAHIEQFSGVLPSTHYLMVASQTGIGRNWLAYALARAFPGHTALGFDLGAALKSGFNGSLSMKLLAVVDELHEGGPGGAHTAAAERLKSMLTETTRLINPKHGRQHTEFNCARFLMFSNHAAALPLADNDRRVIVVENPSQRRSEAYFVELYAWLDNPDFGPALAEALHRRDIAGFNAGAPAPMSEAKARTIRAGRSEIEQAVRDLAREWPSACITSSRLSTEVAATLGGKTFSVQSACVAAGLVKCRGRIRVFGVPSHVWALRDPNAWRDAEVHDIAVEVVRGVQAADGDAFA